MDVLEFHHPTSGLRFSVPLGKIVAAVETGADGQCELVLADGQCWPAAGDYETAVQKIAGAFAEIRNRRPPV